MCIEEGYSTPSRYCQITCNVDFCSWVITVGRCCCNILSHSFYGCTGCTEICSLDKVLCNHCLKLYPEIWNKLPGFNSMGLLGIESVGSNVVAGGSVVGASDCESSIGWSESYAWNPDDNSTVA